MSSLLSTALQTASQWLLPLGLMGYWGTLAIALLTLTLAEHLPSGDLLSQAGLSPAVVQTVATRQVVARAAHVSLR